MNILAIETSSQICSVALIVGEDDFFCSDKASRSHSRSLLPMIESLLSKASIQLSDVDFIAVAIGPGSFTGLRIGVSVAQGLAFGQDIPILSISSLAVVAQAFNDYCCANNCALPVDTVLATMDARMGELYCGYYTVNQCVKHESTRCAQALLVGSEKVLAPQKIDQLLEPPRSIDYTKTVIVGAGSLYADKFPASWRECFYAPPFDVQTILPNAHSLANLARDALQNQTSSTVANEDSVCVVPSYIRNNVTS